MGRKHKDKPYERNSWYHLWNRGHDGRTIFADDVDRRAFLGCLERHLASEQQFDERLRAYRHLHDKIELGAYCLMPNHFHLLVRTLEEPRCLPDLLKRAKTAYALHIRRRHGLDGPLFDGAYEADIVRSRFRLRKATVYVHLNFDDDPDYAFGSHHHLLSGSPPPWLNGAERLLRGIGGAQAYERSLRQTIERRSAKRAIEGRLADLDDEAIALRRQLTPNQGPRPGGANGRHGVKTGD